MGATQRLALAVAEPVRLEVDVQFAAWLAPSPTTRARADFIEILNGDVARAVLAGNSDRARSAALELALWRDSQLTDAERAARVDGMAA